MAKVTRAHRDACQDVQARFLGFDNVVSVGIGFKHQGGARTDTICIVVGVKQKLPEAQVPSSELVPETVGGIVTDVLEYGELKALADIDVAPLALTQKRRPCPPGYSVGHPQVTAGTLGAWVHRGAGNERYILSNNHVIANSNDAIVGDFIRQPGRADGGTDGDRFARLTEFVRIRFDGDNGGDGGGGKKSSAAFGWKVWKWPANAVAKLVDCPFRLVVARPNVVEQPTPNLVDAAVARVLLEEWVDEAIPEIGEVQGFRDLDLGDRVIKTGRTTETTRGIVETVGATSQVDYGAGKGIATFGDQFVIRGDDGDFSQGGDSGSAVVDEDGFIGGLLFAGGGGVTIVNRISHVVSLLGIRL